DVGRNRFAAGSVKAVATRNEIAAQLALFPALPIAQERRARIRSFDAHVLRFVDEFSAERGASLHEIACQLGLAVDHDRTAGVLLKVDPDAAVTPADLDAGVRKPFPVHARGHLRLPNDVDRTLFEHAGADPS